MKRVLLILAAATVGLSAPAIASAQSLGDVLGQVLQAQRRLDDDRGRHDDRGRGNSDHGRGDNRGGDNRGGDNRNRPPSGPYPQPGDSRGRPAGPYQQPGESWRPAAPTGREISMSQALRIVESAAGPGHHLDGSREDRGGRTYYRIQWASDRGERRDYLVDAQTGAIVR
jgi:uncharacterized membrane protein YkoI